MDRESIFNSPNVRVYPNGDGIAVWTWVGGPAHICTLTRKQAIEFARSILAATGGEDAAKEERAKVAEEIAAAIDSVGSYAMNDCICYGHAAAIARELRVPDCGDQYHGADGGPCSRCGFDVAEVNQPRTVKEAETQDTES